ncbi:uncharacterized protein LOC131990162 [Centropristis striata]|uniref:uncharacterized protein LOC131990162 n=1 Tax=Centropristis striata TaxID=184440 RepID=UPI0027E1477A|nr:uncharacterized protein LOC131990162 [Centropristis striata]
MLLLLGFCIIAGVTAKDAPTMHYRLKNSSLCLLVAETPPYHSATWKFHDRVIIFSNQTTPIYRDKVDYNPKNSSLCIHKLTDTDSGIYTFSFINSQYHASTETHRLIVEETVPRPIIRMSGLHSNLSAELCNGTVNCSIQDDWMFSVCDKDGCRTSQRSLRRLNITITIGNKSIICRGNNYVSTNKVSESTEATCLGKRNPEQPTAIIIVIVVAVCVSLGTFAGFVAKGLSSSQYNHNHQAGVSSARIVQSQPVEALSQSLPRVCTSSSTSQAEACYENVGATEPCRTSSPTVSPREELGSKQSQQIDTVYSFLQVQKATSSLGKSDDSEGHKEVQEASASECVGQNEAEHPAQIDTVYSVLQKPQKKPQHHQ